MMRESTTEEVWARVRSRYGDDVAQEAIQSVLTRSEGRHAGYVVFVAQKLRGSGYDDTKSRVGYRRKLEHQVLVRPAASLEGSTGRLSLEAWLDLKRYLAGLSPEKRAVLARTIDRGTTRGRLSRGLKAEMNGGAELVVKKTLELTPEQRQAYRDRHERGEYIPRSIARKLGVPERRRGKWKPSGART